MPRVQTERTAIPTNRMVSGNRFSSRDMGKCLSFDGNDRINTPYHVSLDAQDKFSFFFWLYGGGNTPSNGRVIRNNINAWQIYVNSQATQGVTFNYGGNFRNLLPIKSKKWYFIGVTFDESLVSNNFKLYFNAVLVDQYTQTNSLTSSPSSDLRIATEETYNYFTGALDEIRMWKNYVLSSEEILNLMYNGVVPARETLSLEYLFDDSAVPATDSSGNGNNGVITGATYSTNVFLKNRTVA